MTHLSTISLYSEIHEMLKMEEKLYILSDKEIENPDDDLIGFKPIAKSLRRIVLEATPPFTIGVIGSWGVGKTSLMRMVQNLLGEEPTIWFDAWAHDRAEDLRLSLIKRILEEMGKAPGLWNKLKSRVKKLGERVDWTNFANWLLSLVPSQGQPLKMKEQAETANDFMEEFKRLAESYLVTVRKNRLVVFIDDLDRCTPPKPLEILEAIKLFLWVDSCVFVIGMQKETVENSILMKYPDKGRTLLSETEYLDKIFQLEYPLRELKRYDIQGFIDKLREQNKISEMIAKYSRVISTVGGNLRRVKRLLNKFEMYRTLKSEDPELRDAIEDDVLAKLLVLEYHPRWKRLHKYITDPLHINKDRKSAILLALGEMVQSSSWAEIEKRDHTTEGFLERREVGALDEFRKDENLIEFLDEAPSLWDVEIESYVHLVGGRIEPMPEDILEGLMSEDILECMSAKKKISEMDEKAHRAIMRRIVEMTYESDVSIVMRATTTLGDLRDTIPNRQLDRIVDRLLQLATSPSPDVRKSVPFPLSMLTHRMTDHQKQKTIDRLLELTKDSNPDVVSHTAIALRRLPNRVSIERQTEIIERLLELSLDSKSVVRAASARAMGEMGRRIPYDKLDEVTSRLFELSGDPESNVRAVIAEVLCLPAKHMLGEDVGPFLKKLIELSKDIEADVRLYASCSFGELADYIPGDLLGEVTDRLVELSKDPELEIRVVVAETFVCLTERIPEDRLDLIIKTLLELSKDVDWNIRRAVVMAFDYLTDRIPQHLLDEVVHELQKLAKDVPGKDMRQRATVTLEKLTGSSRCGKQKVDGGGSLE